MGAPGRRPGAITSEPASVIPKHQRGEQQREQQEQQPQQQAGQVPAIPKDLRPVRSASATVAIGVIGHGKIRRTRPTGEYQRMPTP